MFRARNLLVFLLPLPLAVEGCGDSGGGGTSGGETEDGSESAGSVGSTSSGETATTTTSGGATDEGSGSSGPGTGTTGSGATCGDGVVDEGEQCDDGNAEDDDECSNACVPPCGIEDPVALDYGSDQISPFTLVGGMTEATAYGLGSDGKLWRRGYDKSGPTADAESGDAGFNPMDLVVALREASNGDLVVFGYTPVPQTTVTTPFVARLSGSALTQTWRVDVPYGGATTIGYGGLALLASDDVVFTHAVNVAAGDDDVRVTRLAFADGAEAWSEDFSGPLQGGYSLDGEGPVAVGSGDRIFALGLLRIDFQTHNTTVVEYGPDGGAPVSRVEAVVDPGPYHSQQVTQLTVATDADSALYVGVSVLGAANDGDLAHVVKIDNGAVAWDWTSPVLGPDGSWGRYAEVLMVDDVGRVVVGGAFVQPVDAMSGLPALFTAALDSSDGSELCLRDHSRADVFATGRGLAPWPDGTPARIMTESYGATNESFIAGIRLP